MSLQLAAQHLAAHGRGPDNTLVHMTPKEVESLQALAQQHGGSLTINPQTGLPEAGFLSSILPLVAGAGLTAMGVPASMAALTVGGGTALATGSLGKGLAAGLGAYGGSNLTASLIGSGAGVSAAAAAPTAAAVNAVPTETAAQIAAAPPIQVAPPAMGTEAADYQKAFDARQARLGDQFRFAEANQIGGVPSVLTTIPQTTVPMAQGVVAEGGFPVPREALARSNSAASGSMDSYGTNAGYLDQPIQRGDLSRLSNANNATAGGPMGGPSVAESKYPSRVEMMTPGERFEALKAGATGKNLLNYAKENPMITAGMLAGPLMGAYEDYKDANKAPETKGDSDRGAMANAGYEYDPGWANPTPRADPYGREQIYNRPRYYVPKKAADGGMMQHFDEGGMVARASQSPMLQQFIEDQATRAAQPAPAQVDVKQQFADYLKAQAAPTTGTVPVTSTPIASTAPALSTAGISALTPQTLGSESHGLSMEQRQERDDPNAWGNLTDQQQSAYFVDNPNMAKATQLAQGLWNGSYLGQFQNWADPSIQAKYQAIQDRANEARQLKDALQNAPVQNLSYITQNPYETGRGVVPAPDNSGGLEGNSGGNFRGGFGGGEGGFNTSGGGSAEGAAARAGMGFGGSGLANGGGITALAQGGTYNLGSYSDGGRLLRGPGDGVSDSIPAVIGQKQPARLADGEFVVPARIVSEIGNGSTEAGARKLYAMMDRVQKARGKTVGKGKVARNTRADKYLPA